MRTTEKDDSDPKGSAGPLAIAWLIVFAAVAAVVGWLYVSSQQAGTVAVIGMPRITVPLPPPPGAAPAQTANAPQAAPQPTPPPESPAAAPPPSAEQQPATPPPEPAKPQAPPETAATQAPLPPPAEAKPPEPKPADAKPPETKPIEAKPAEAKPPEPKPAEAKTAEAKPAKPEAASQAQKAPEKTAEKAPEKASEKTGAPAEAPAQAGDQVATLPIEPRLTPAPDPALVEHGREGPLPTIGPDGRQPWQVYARPFDATDKRPRIAVVITDLGLSGAATESAIQQLPGGVTLAFSPYSKNLDQWTGLARTAGHEVLLDLPMEPLDYPEQDPGPYTLLTSLDPKQNLFKMEWLLSRATGYVGVTNHMGSRFTTSGPDLRPVLDAIKTRGLLFLDSRSSEQSVAAKMANEMGMPSAYNNRFIDATASRDAIDHQLEDVEKVAKKSGFAVAMGTAYPVTIERVAAWIPNAERQGFVIAPVSAIVNKQPTK